MLVKPSLSPKAFSPYRKRLANEARDAARTREKSRGRLEVRTLTATTIGIDMCDWPAVKQFLRLERQTTINNTTTTRVQYAATSLPREQAGAAQLLKLWRGRWEIESTFWVKDAVFREDHSRIRTGLAPRAMSAVRNAAINILRTLKVPNLAAARRENALKVNLLLSRLGIINKS